MAYESKKLNADIRGILAEAPPSTKWGVAVLDQGTFKVIAGVNRNMHAEALSISKLTTAALVGRLVDLGGFALEAQIKILESDVREGGYLGRLQNQSVQILKLAQGMLHVSDTTGQRALTRIMGGPEACNRVILANQLQRSGIRIPPLTVTKFVPVDGEQGSAARFYTGNTTPVEAAELLGTALTSSLTREALQQNIFGYGLTRDLPGNELPNNSFMAALAEAQDTDIPFNDSALATLQRPSWRSAFPNIMGIDEGQSHDVAQIGGFLVAVLATNLDPTLVESPLHPAREIQAQLGQAILVHA